MPKKGDANFDKFLITILENKFQTYYRPLKEVSVDESMVKFKGRISFKQYISMKPVKRGYTIWVCADKEGYVNNFEIYTGKQDGQAESGLGERVVLQMIEGLEGKSHQVYFDNFFTTTDMIASLPTKLLYACEAVRPSRKNLAKDLKHDKDLNRGDYDWWTCKSTYYQLDK